MFQPRHSILSNVRAGIRKYVVSWLKHSRESDRPVPGPIYVRASRAGIEFFPSESAVMYDVRSLAKESDLRIDGSPPLLG